VDEGVLGAERLDGVGELLSAELGALVGRHALELPAPAAGQPTSLAASSRRRAIIEHGGVTSVGLGTNSIGLRFEPSATTEPRF
jgi:hypothetical protein